MNGPAADTSSSGVILRDVAESDLPIFFANEHDPVANEMAVFPARDRETFMAYWAKILGDETVAKQTILIDGQVAGNIMSFERFGKREVGYWIAREHWGKGIATRALEAFLTQVTVRPLIARVAKHNVGSRRVLEKCGFTITGEEDGPPDKHGKPVIDLILTLRA